MPFPRTWLEELVIEWLYLEGFLVEGNLPIGVRGVGGRLEVDVVGARISNGILEIVHVETGQLAGGQKGAQDILNKKFSPFLCEAVMDYFRQRLSFGGSYIKYEKRYVASYWTMPTLTALRQAGIRADTLPSFIATTLLPTIEKWKQAAPHKPKGKAITLPESYWLLRLIDFLKDRGMLKA